MHVQWLFPAWAWPLLGLVAFGVWIVVRLFYRQTIPAPTQGTRRLLVGLRTAALALLLLALAQPVLLRLLSREESAVVAVVVEDSGSEALTDAGPGGAALSRWDAAWSLAAAVDSVLSQRADAPAIVMMQGNGLRPAELADPTVVTRRTPRAVGTDLRALLAQVEQRLLGRHLRAVVLMADGNVTADDTDTAPVPTPGIAATWLVGLGDPVGPADRLLTDLRFPEMVFRGEAATVEVTVADRFRTEPGGSDSVRVTLRRGDTVLATQSRASIDDVHTFLLTYTPASIGLQVLTVEVSPLANERFLANNQATLVIDVRKDRARLLLLTARPDWDVRFLAQAASSEPRLALSVVYPGPDGLVLADSLGAFTLPTTVDGWREWDGVVLDGAPGKLLSDGGQSLASAVGEGVGLLVLAADEPVGNGGGATWSPALTGVFPVTLRGQGAQSVTAFVAPTPDAPRHPVLAGVTYGDGDAGALASLPPLRALTPAEVREGAQVLLEATVGRGEAAGRPLLVVSAPGRDRVLWFGGRRLWELAFWENPGEPEAATTQPVRQLLRNLLVWTALGGQEGGLALLGHKVAYQEGQPVHVEAQWLDVRGQPVSDRTVSLVVAPEAGDDAAPERTYAMRAELDRPGVTSVDLPPLPPGRYTLTPRAEGGPADAGASRPLVITPATVEQTQVRQDRRQLRQLAARVHATLLDGADAGDRAQLLASLGQLDLSPQPRSLRRRWDIWASWPYLTLVVLLLGVEWLVRRRHGML